MRLRIAEPVQTGDDACQFTFENIFLASGRAVVAIRHRLLKTLGHIAEIGRTNRPGHAFEGMCYPRHARPVVAFAQTAKLVDESRTVLRLELTQHFPVTHPVAPDVAQTDRRIDTLLKKLEASGVSLEDELATADKFDPKYLSKIVD